MAYKIQRSNDKIIDTLELISQDGEIKAVLDVEIHLPRIAGTYRPAVLEVARAQEAYRSAKQECGDPVAAVTAVGCACVAVFTVVFGEKNTNALLTFFEHNYDEMLRQIEPFLTEVVSPAIQGYVSRCRKEAMQRSRKYGKKH